LNPSSIGSGLAVVISPNDDSLGDVGGYLILGENGFVAVEFDTLVLSLRIRRIMLSLRIIKLIKNFSQQRKTTSSVT